MKPVQSSELSTPTVPHRPGAQETALMEEKYAKPKARVPIDAIARHWPKDLPNTDAAYSPQE